MPAEEPFHELLKRVRAGDQEAAAEVVRQYEPEIRRVVRMRLTDPRMRRVLDSMDICQSVMANFFVRAAAGQFDLDTPDQLLKLLATMAKNRLLNHVSRQQAERRDQRRVRSDGDEALDLVASPEETPSQIVSGEELLRQAQSRLTKEERRLAELRTQGESWASIAKTIGDSPEALRKKLTRAMDRVVAELGLDEAAPK